MIKQIFDGDEKKRITRQILEALPDLCDGVEVRITWHRQPQSEKTVVFLL